MTAASILALILADINLGAFFAALEPFGADLVAGKSTPEEFRTVVVASLDALVDWSKVIPGPVGATMEAGDSAALTAAVDWFVNLAHHKAHKAAGALTPAPSGKFNLFAAIEHVFAKPGAAPGDALVAAG